MLSASRISIKISFLPLITQGKICITSAQLFGLNAQLYQAQKGTPPNFQFVVDSLSTSDKERESSLDLQVNSFIIRHGSISYDRLDQPRTHQFNPNHLHFSDISAHLILNKLSNDSLNLNIKRLSFKESSGLDINSLYTNLLANKSKAQLHGFSLKLPHSSIAINNIDATYQLEEAGNALFSHLKFKGTLAPSTIVPADLQCFSQVARNYHTPIELQAQFTGTQTSVTLHDLSLRAPEQKLLLTGNGGVDFGESHPIWNAHITHLSCSNEGLEQIAHLVHLDKNTSEILSRLGGIHLTATANGTHSTLSAHAAIKADVGTVTAIFQKTDNDLSGQISTSDLDLQRVLADKRFGHAMTQFRLQGKILSRHQLSLNAIGDINYLDFNQYPFKNIHLDGHYQNGAIRGNIDVDDPNATIRIQGTATLNGQHQMKLAAQVQDFNPSAMNLTKKWPKTRFSFSTQIDVQSSDFQSSKGSIDINQLAMVGPSTEFHSDNIHIEKRPTSQGELLTLDSDFANLSILGRCHPESLPQCIANILREKLPTIPGLPQKGSPTNNNFSIRADIRRSDWLQAFFDTPLALEAPMDLEGSIDEQAHKIDLSCTLPAFSYAESRYENAIIHITSPNDTLQAEATIEKLNEDGRRFSLRTKAKAADNNLGTEVSFYDHARRPFKGHVMADANFFYGEQGQAMAHVNVHPSEIVVGDSIWQVEPSDIVYSKNRLIIDHFAINHNQQHAHITGIASPNPQDSVFVDLNGIDIGYILYLVNFHAVDFDGKASGKAWVSAAFSTPHAAADLTVHDFRFENGRMGTLHALANLNQEEQRIDINATASDPNVNGETLINGYVSPFHNTIDLGIFARNTRLEFLESFCRSFMDNVQAKANGEVRLHGTLDNINLTGRLVADGGIHMKTLNTDYTLRADTIVMVPDEIVFHNDTIYDRNGNIGIVDGAIHHKHLTKLSYDLGIRAQNLLAYDTHDFGDDTFYGTAYATGTCTISGRSGETVIDVNAKPERGSIIVYNAASPDAIRDGEFIQWTSHKATHNTPQHVTEIPLPAHDIPSDMRLNFIINCTPDATLRVVMDRQTGDYIDLNGDGMLRASYYNKGAFDIYGNYVVDHGIYKLTIQNVIKKDFQFQQGGTITFGGDPYNAALQLKAMYTVSGVPLSDLNIGRSFTSNNIRVNCLMNIQGTPAQPTVDFSFDMPTVGADAKEMIMSLINSEEEMNQQVLYLLAVGRFLNQGSNNAASEDASQQSQTSLAMQSLLSGTLSQQINNLLSSVANNSNWTFGANISTGDEGFNNAQYEGLLSGRMLGNRLIFNGEFGYRDNTNATTSFIGDFDLRYLIYPNGNLAIKVYNQSNDRYFTRNSLNTQGIGLIWKRDFNGWSELFRRKERQRSQQP